MIYLKHDVQVAEIGFCHVDALALAMSVRPWKSRLQAQPPWLDFQAMVKPLLAQPPQRPPGPSKKI